MLSPNGIKAIFFDLDGTLRFSHPAGRDYFLDYAEGLGVSITPETRAHIWRWEHSYWAESQQKNDDLTAYPNDQDFWRNYGRRMLIQAGCNDQTAATLAPIVNLYMNENYHPDSCIHPATPNLLQQLRECGYFLAVLSNRDKPFEDELEKHGLKDYFQATYHAAEINAWKPNPAIFHYAIEKAGFSPHETIYVGDNYFADVVGAKNAGLTPVLLDERNIFANYDCIKIQTLQELPVVLEALKSTKANASINNPQK